MIVDEFGNVLTFEDQKRYNEMDIENSFNLRLEGKDIGKVSSGNSFFLCIPENMNKNYTKNQGYTANELKD